MGALLAGAGDEIVQAMANYGYNLGLAFQIVDDVLDVVGDPEVMGKPVGSDIVKGAGAIIAQNGKKTSIAVKISPDGKDPIRDMLARLRDSGAVDVAMAQAREYSSRAINALDIVDDSPPRRELVALAKLAVQRQR